MLAVCTGVRAHLGHRTAVSAAGPTSVSPCPFDTLAAAEQEGVFHRAEPIQTVTRGHEIK